MSRTRAAVVINVVDRTLTVTLLAEIASRSYRIHRDRSCEFSVSPVPSKYSSFELAASKCIRSIYLFIHIKDVRYTGWTKMLLLQLNY